MKKNIALYYFTGTGNTRLIGEAVRNHFEREGLFVTMVDMAGPEELPLREGDWTLGFLFPVYGLTLPKLVRKFIGNLPPGGNREYFLIANGHSNTGKSRTAAARILDRKGYRLIGTASTFTPSSSIITEETEPEETAAGMREEALLKARHFAADLLMCRAEIEREETSFRNKAVSLLFSVAMPGMLLKKTSVGSSCKSCGFCASICPVGNIAMSDGTPVWGKNCEVCMRCINYCPTRSIEMMNSPGKRPYREPGFEKILAGGMK